MYLPETVPHTSTLKVLLPAQNKTTKQKL